MLNYATILEPKIEKIFRKNQTSFRRNQSISQNLTIRRILDGIHAKKLAATILFVEFSKAFDSIHRGKIEQRLLAYSPHQRNRCSYNKAI